MPGARRNIDRVYLSWRHTNPLRDLTAVVKINSVDRPSDHHKKLRPRRLRMPVRPDVCLGLQCDKQALHGVIEFRMHIEMSTPSFLASSLG